MGVSVGEDDGRTSGAGAGVPASRPCVLGTLWDSDESTLELSCCDSEGRELPGGNSRRRTSSACSKIGFLVSGSGTSRDLSCRVRSEAGRSERSNRSCRALLSVGFLSNGFMDVPFGFFLVRCPTQEPCHKWVVRWCDRATVRAKRWPEEFNSGRSLGGKFWK